VSGFGSTGVRNRITADGAPGQVGTVHVVVPDGIDDHLRPSGGNAYDRRICAGLAVLGRSVREHAVTGPWPRPDGPSRERFTRVIAALPDGAVVLLDGLIASAVPEVLVPESGRLRLVVLVHLPLGHPPAGEQAAAAEAGVSARERAVLTAAARVVTTSSWTRGWLVDRYALRPSRIHVATPGVDAADPAPGSAAGSELLCVAAVTPGKGHDVLLAALASIADLRWRLSCVGSLTRDPDFADRVGRQARTEGIADRVCLTGALAVADLDRMYAAADMLVLASRGETYGMVVTEALARGMPVIASTAGLPEAVGHGTDGVRPGILVPARHPAAPAAALRDWLTDAGLRQRLRSVARDRRATLSGWSDTSATLSRVLAEMAA